MHWIDLIYNFSILLALSVLSGFVDLRWKRDTAAGIVLQGIVFGSATCIGMSLPLVLENGLFIDGRSVMLGLGGLFFGARAVSVAALMSLAFRVSQGGAGVAMGTMVILSSATLGACFNRRWGAQLAELSAKRLVGFGLGVSAVLLAMTVALPTERILPVVTRIAWPVLLLYPLATVLIGKILVDQAARDRHLNDLRASELRHRQILQMAMDGCWCSDLQGVILEVNAAYSRMSGYEVAELLAKRMSDLEEHPGETAARLQEIKREGNLRYETRHRRKDGSFLDLELSAQYSPELGGRIVFFLHDVTQRKRADEALSQSHELMRYVIEYNQSALAVHDRELKYLYVSKRYLHDYGVKEDDIIGKHHYDVFPDLPMKWRIVHQRALAGEVSHCDEDSYERADGTVEWTRWECRPWRQRDGTVGGIIVYTEVITAQKLARDYQQMSLDILRVLNEQHELSDAIQRVLEVIRLKAGFDAVGLRLQEGEDFPYYAHQGFSPEFLSTENSIVERSDSGVCRDEFGRAGLECTCGLVISGKTDPASPLFTQGGSFWTNESRLLLDLPKDKDPRRKPRNHCIHQGYASVALIPLRREGRILGMLHLNNRRRNSFTLETIERLEQIASHIAEALVRRQAEESLLQSEARLSLALRAAHMGIWQWDILSGKRTFDDQTCSLLGLSRAAFNGTASEFFAVVHPDDRDNIKRCLARTVTDNVPYAPEYRVVLPDGTIRQVAAAGRLVCDADGKPKCLMGVLWDNTEHMLIAEQQQRVQTLESVGTLAGGIAHDFNNILQGVFGYMSLAKEALSKNDPAHALLEESDRSMARAIRLTQQLVTFSKGGTPIREDVALGNLVEEVARFDLSGSNVRLVCQCPDGLWNVDADRGQIQQVISNLVINARQAMPGGGALTITLENVERADEAEPPLPPGKYVKVSVTDEGLGIDQSSLAHIFEPYFTSKRTGNGLGLATVLSIVNRHGGHIAVKSELSKGTTFTVHLPVGATTRNTVTEAAPLARPEEQASARILVMDDEVKIGQLVKLMLKPAGHRVEWAADAKQAVSMYRESVLQGSPYDLVVLDLTITGGPGGVEVIKELQALNPSVKAIASSGYAESAVLSDPAAYGFTAMVAKPFTMAALRDAVARALR